MMCEEDYKRPRHDDLHHQLCVALLTCNAVRKMHLGNIEFKKSCPTWEFYFEKLLNCILSGRLKSLAPCPRWWRKVEQRQRNPPPPHCPSCRCSSSGWRPQRSPCLLRPQGWAEQVGARWSTRDHLVTTSALCCAVTHRSLEPFTSCPDKNPQKSRWNVSTYRRLQPRCPWLKTVYTFLHRLMEAFVRPHSMTIQSVSKGPEQKLRSDGGGKKKILV